jgi:hypothetical protein
MNSEKYQIEDNQLHLTEIKPTGKIINIPLNALARYNYYIGCYNHEYNKINDKKLN